MAMTWTDFYLVCFFVGFALSVLSLLPQRLHIPHIHAHLPHLPLPHVHTPHVHVGHAGGSGSGSSAAETPAVNFATLPAFLTWFGGTGYLLVRLTGLKLFFALGLAVLSGCAGASIVFLVLAKVLMRKDEDLDPADYEMVGVLGRLSIPIRKGGTGEIVFTQAGTRHSEAARSEDGAEISKGVEVVVTRYEKGIAYVRPWAEMAGEDTTL
jgi:hypothetical protein